MQSLWRAACLDAFTDADLAANIHICKAQHKCGSLLDPCAMPVLWTAVQ
jgi:hypothetical protein